MQPIQINVSVNIGVNQELHGLLSALLNHPQVEAETAAPAPRKQRTAKAQPVVEKKPEAQPQPEPQPETTKEKEETPEPQPETTAEETEPAANPTPGTKEYTEVDVRAAMDRTRKRIEGENYKEQTDSEGYKKWHRALTGWFKNTAALCGAEKPSALPDSKSRYEFISCCDEVYVKDDELTYKCPF
ncbi:hypothetical protein [uncultured Bacteroides sp.]|uniref:hypothetical protein n=1 Tax=uncultured Bacteroides sp. TaxID=162156 RepID=UPI0025E4DC9F|nr:hypothetical protein [uncultured Bacteroides sp.]